MSRTDYLTAIRDCRADIVRMRQTTIDRLHFLKAEVKDGVSGEQMDGAMILLRLAEIDLAQAGIALL